MNSPRILFEDTHLLVLSKPAGVLSQSDVSGEESLVDWLRNYLGRPYVGLVHRLDRNTSGLMVVAKRTKSARRLTDALVSGELERSYRAWIHGKLSQTEKWQHSLLKDEQNNQVRVIKELDRSLPPGLKAKQARLTVTPIAQGEWKQHPLTLVEFYLDTGRSHQIRVQAATEGHPLLGDIKYPGPGKRAIAPEFGRPALHSFRIRFPHPMSKEILEWEDPLPPDMSSVSITDP